MRLAELQYSIIHTLMMIEGKQTFKLVRITGRTPEYLEWDDI